LPLHLVGNRDNTVTHQQVRARMRERAVLCKLFAQVGIFRMAVNICLGEFASCSHF
jgi:hypothetical protein